MTMGADPVACAALAAGRRRQGLLRAQGAQEHGLQRWVEGPVLEAGERCLIVEDVVTTGRSTVQAIERVREEGFEIAGVIERARPAGRRREAIEAAAARPTGAHDDRRRLPGPPLIRRASRRSAAVRSSTAGRARCSPRPAAAASTSARSNQRTSAARRRPAAGPRSASALKPIISELGNGHGWEAT